MERRLNRIERVAAAYRGQIDLRFDNCLTMTFQTADAALLAACEMQLRCAVLPQVSQCRLALRIGIRESSVRQRSQDSAEKPLEEASALAIADDEIIVTETVFLALNRDLQKLTHPYAGTPLPVATFKSDWRSEIPSSAYGGESFWPTSVPSLPAGPYLVLYHGMKTLELREDNPVVTIGRAPLCDLVLTDIHVSRSHCRIEREADRILLTDSSTNGTCVLTDDGNELLVKNDSYALEGKGLLFFGRPFNGERRGGVRYESL